MEGVRSNIFGGSFVPNEKIKGQEESPTIEKTENQAKKSFGKKAQSLFSSFSSKQKKISVDKVDTVEEEKSVKTEKISEEKNSEGKKKKFSFSPSFTRKVQSDKTYNRKSIDTTTLSSINKDLEVPTLERLEKLVDDHLLSLNHLAELFRDHITFTTLLSNYIMTYSPNLLNNLFSDPALNTILNTQASALIKKRKEAKDQAKKSNGDENLIFQKNIKDLKVEYGESIFLAIANYLGKAISSAHDKEESAESKEALYFQEIFKKMNQKIQIKFLKSIEKEEDKIKIKNDCEVSLINFFIFQIFNPLFKSSMVSVKRTPGEKLHREISFGFATKYLGSSLPEVIETYPTTFKPLNCLFD